MRFQIVSNLCSRGEIEKAKKIAHDSNQENLNQSLIFAPIILHLLTADEGLKTEKLNEVIALLPYLNKKSKLEISDLKQKSQELATDLNNRFENEKADKLYANIALLLSKNERIKEGLSVIKKIKNEELQNNTISLAIHLSRETRSIFSSSQNENLISKNLFLFLDKYLPSKERENHLLRNFFCIEFIKNLCSKNKVDQALIVLDHELKCCTRPKVENHLLKDSCYIEIIKNACEKIQINLALKILNEDLKSPEKQKIAFNIIMQKVSEENCFIELFELAKNLSENKNTAHLQKKIYSKLALHYANYFSDDYHLQSVLNGITSPLELNIFQTSILELINRESNDQALTAIQAFKIPNERNQDRKTAMLKEVALGFIRQENFESAIELIVSMEEGDQWQVIEKAFLMLMQPEKYSDADSFITMISMILPELTNQMLLTSVNNYCSRFNFKGACLSAMMISSKDIKEDATNTIKRYLIEQLNKEELEKLAPIGNAFLRMTILGYHEQARELIKMIPEKFSIEKHRLFLSIIETFCQNNAIDHAYQTMLMLEDLEKQMQVTKEILPILINKSFYIQACSFINVVATELQINNKELFLSTLANYCKNHYFYYAWRMIDVMENKDGKQEAQEIIKEALFSLLCTDHLDKLELIKTAFFGLVDEEHYIQASSFINMVPAHKFPEEIKQIYISTFDELWFEEKAEKAIAVIFSVGSNNKEQQLQLAYEIYLHLLSIDSDVAAIFVYTLLQYNHINEQEMIYFFRS